MASNLKKILKELSRKDKQNYYREQFPNEDKDTASKKKRSSLKYKRRKW